MSPADAGRLSLLLMEAEAEKINRSSVGN